MARVGPFLAFLALVALQVPWVVCISDCRQSTVTLVGEHSCHDEDAHHHHGEGEGENEDGDPEGGTHVLLSVEALPPQSVIQVIAPAALPWSTATVEHTVHEPEGAAFGTTGRDAVPRPPAVAERLLL